MQLKSTPGGLTEGRLYRLEKQFTALSDEERLKARIEVCSDEHTGVRYGQRNCRKGRCLKLGSGGRASGSKSYQVWLVWS